MGNDLFETCVNAKYPGLTLPPAGGIRKTLKQSYMLRSSFAGGSVRGWK